MPLKDQLRGTGVALVTPFKKDKSVDFEALHAVINFVIEDGVDYLVTLGTTGETPTLSLEERRDIVDFTFSVVGARVPIVIGIGGNNTRAVIDEMENYPIEKSIAILSASPYYNKPSQEGLFQHYKAIASATIRPVILYN